MRTLPWAFSAVLLLACSGGSSTSAGGDDASTGPVQSGSPDAGTFMFIDDAGIDAGPLLTSCNPSNPSSCPSGFTCYPDHTSASWWVDLYEKCTFDCSGQTYALCDSLGGVCGCPVPEDASAGDCSLDGGESMVCVPSVKPGTTPGANEGDGGCGTPGCAGPPFDSGTAGVADAGGD